MNKVCLYGQIMTEPRFGTSRIGKKFCSVQLGLSKKSKNKKKIVVPVVFFDDMAEQSARILHSRMRIGIEGCLGMSEFKGTLRLSVIGTSLYTQDKPIINLDDEVLDEIASDYGGGEGDDE